MDGGPLHFHHHGLDDVSVPGRKVGALVSSRFRRGSCGRLRQGGVHHALLPHPRVLDRNAIGNNVALHPPPRLPAHPCYRTSRSKRGRPRDAENRRCGRREGGSRSFHGEHARNHCAAAAPTVRIWGCRRRSGTPLQLHDVAPRARPVWERAGVGYDRASNICKPYEARVVRGAGPVVLGGIPGQSRDRRLVSQPRRVGCPRSSVVRDVPPPPDHHQRVVPKANAVLPVERCRLHAKVLRRVHGHIRRCCSGESSDREPFLPPDEGPPDAFS
mmetsp:Transcript_5951/g.8379  ORF Transcript_5951/g.8379 Transcript_5951/m.8379 type:complete len:272 (-) Transcript_5951:604-1419(-)